MKRRKLLVIGMLGAVSAGTLTLCDFSAPREPVRGGQRLSERLEKLATSVTVGAPEADLVVAYQEVAAFGQEAVPWLIWRARANDGSSSVLKSEPIRWLSEQSKWINDSLRDAGAEKERRHGEAIFGLQTIRPEADPAFRTYVLELASAEKGMDLMILGPAAVPYLLELQSHPSATVRANVLLGFRVSDFTPAGVPLGKVPAELIPKIIDAYLRGLDDPDLKVRRMAARRLSLSCLPVVEGPRKTELEYWNRIDGTLRQKRVERLILALDDPDKKIRVSAVTGLGRCGAEAAAAVPKLVGMLEAPPASYAPRMEIADSLGSIGQTADLVVPAMRGLMDDRDPRTRLAAAKTLVRFGVKDEKLVGELAAQLGEEYLRREDAILIFDALQQMGDAAVDQAWFAIVEKALPSLSSEIRNEFIDRFKGTWQRKVPELIAALSHPKIEVRIFAVRALPIDDERSKTALRAFAKDRQMERSVMAKLDEIEKHAREQAPQP